MVCCVWRAFGVISIVNSKKMAEGIGDEDDDGNHSALVGPRWLDGDVLLEKKGRPASDR